MLAVIFLSYSESRVENKKHWSHGAENAYLPLTFSKLENVWPLHDFTLWPTLAKKMHNPTIYSWENVQPQHVLPKFVIFKKNVYSRNYGKWFAKKKN